MSKFYLTTAIDYPSARPHLGHAYEKIMADVLARWHRLKGEEVFFLTGTDEHGQKIERKAKSQGKSPQEYVDSLSMEFKNLWQKLSISHDDFIRTTEERHIRPCRDVFAECFRRGYIYKGLYKGLYCVECEGYYTEKELKNGLCPVHDKAVEMIEEECYFLAASRFAVAIQEEIKVRGNFIEPSIRQGEILNRLSQGLRDLCVSRSTFTWGIPLPIDSRHIIFVWFDALLNYITGLGYPGDKFRHFWPADVHIIGKDILWFHAVIWPAILMSAGLEWPKKIFVHGFVNISGQKLSKSKGLVVDPQELLSRYSADALRYFLMREIPSGEDGNFSEEALVKRINSDLANDLGNLLSRSLTMLERFNHGTIPERPREEEELDRKLKAMAIETFQSADNYISSITIHKALESIFELIRQANQYVEANRPWDLAVKDKKRLQIVLYNLAESLRFISVLLTPFMPQAALEIRSQLGLSSEPCDFSELKSWGLIPPKLYIKKGISLFPRIT